MNIGVSAAAIGVALSGVFATGVSAADAGLATQADLPTLSINRAGLSARATLGSFCVTPPATDETGTGLCADSRYPLRVRGRLPVRPGGRVVLKSSVRARVVVARLVRVDGAEFETVGRRLAVRRISPRRWAVRLRNDLGGANVLDVSMRWRNPRDGRGDASFWGGIRRSCRG